MGKVVGGELITLPNTDVNLSITQRAERKHQWQMSTMSLTPIQSPQSHTPHPESATTGTAGSKRKPSDNYLSPRVPQWRRIATPDSDSPSHLQSPPNKDLPLIEPGSLNDILRQNNRTRLFVPPIAWSAIQPQLLECRFVNKGRLPRENRKSLREPAVAASPDGAGKPLSTIAGFQHNDILRAAGQLCQTAPVTIKTNALKEILSTQGFHSLE